MICDHASTSSSNPRMSDKYLQSSIANATTINQSVSYNFLWYTKRVAHINYVYVVLFAIWVLSIHLIRLRRAKCAHLDSWFHSRLGEDWINADIQMCSRGWCPIYINISSTLSLLNQPQYSLSNSLSHGRVLIPVFGSSMLRSISDSRTR